MSKESFLQEFKIVNDLEALRVVGSAFLQEAGIDRIDFERFLNVMGLEEDLIYEDIIVLKRERGEASVQSYIVWMKNVIEDSKRFDSDVVSEVRIHPLDEKSDESNPIDGIKLVILFIVVVTVIGFFF